MIVIPSKEEIKEAQDQRLKEHLEMEARKAEKAKKRAAYLAKSKARFEKQVDEYIKNKPKVKEEPRIFLNTRKPGPKASDWLKSFPASEVTEEDLEREVAFWFDSGK